MIKFQYSIWPKVMLNFYQIVKENLQFNRFQYRETVCLEYTCPIDAEQIGIYSRNDYLVHVLSGKKTYTTLNGEWTLTPGETLYIKKGAEIIHQYFDDQYCMLGFFISDHLIRETFRELQGKVRMARSQSSFHSTAFEVSSSDFLEGYFLSMLAYFRGQNRPPDDILLLKLKELLVTLMKSDPLLTAYFARISDDEKPSISEVMEHNFCFNLKLEQFADLCHRSLSTFKREFQQTFNESPGKWLLRKRVERAANLISNTDKSITQIAFDAGFEDLSHFSRAFKKLMGMTPSKFKNH